MNLFVAPNAVETLTAAPAEDFERYRAAHPLERVLPVLRRLLLEPAERAGMLVAIADEHARLLRVEGDRDAQLRAASMDFVAGADWSEAAIGASALGTALTDGTAAQIAGSEHFAPAAQHWPSTAVPMRDPRGRLIGAIHLTGRREAAAPLSLALLRAAAAAAEAELRIVELHGTHRSHERTLTLGAGKHSAAIVDAVPLPRVLALGRERAILEGPLGRVELGGRHGEIVVSLAWYREGLRSGELGPMLFGDAARAVTLRAEIARLRRVLDGCGVQLASRPYRLLPEVHCDARAMLSAVDHGHHRRALALRTGPLLPGSDAPGIIALRAELEASLREQILDAGSVETLLQYTELPGTEPDVRLLRELLRRLPPRSSRRARLVVRLESIEADLSP